VKVRQGCSGRRRETCSGDRAAPGRVLGPVPGRIFIRVPELATFAAHPARPGADGPVRRLDHPVMGALGLCRSHRGPRNQLRTGRTFWRGLHHGRGLHGGFLRRRRNPRRGFCCRRGSPGRLARGRSDPCGDPRWRRGPGRSLGRGGRPDRFSGLYAGRHRDRRLKWGRATAPDSQSTILRFPSARTGGGTQRASCGGAPGRQLGSESVRIPSPWQGEALS
jgi:hypothetical protein